MSSTTPVGRVPLWIAWGRVPSPICAGEICSATSSPDSRWRRFLKETAARKSGRSRIGAFLLDLFKVRYHCPWYLLNSSVERWYVWFCFASSSISMQFLFCPANCELWFTIDLVSEKAIVNTFEMFTVRVNSFAASLPRIPCYMVLFLFFSFTVSSTKATPFLDHVVRDFERASSLILLDFLLDSLSTKNCPQVQ